MDPIRRQRNRGLRPYIDPQRDAEDPTFHEPNQSDAPTLDPPLYLALRLRLRVRRSRLHAKDAAPPTEDITATATGYATRTNRRSRADGTDNGPEAATEHV